MSYNGFYFLFSLLKNLEETDFDFFHIVLQCTFTIYAGKAPNVYSKSILRPHCQGQNRVILSGIAAYPYLREKGSNAIPETWTRVALVLEKKIKTNS